MKGRGDRAIVRVHARNVQTLGLAALMPTPKKGTPADQKLLRKRLEALDKKISTAQKKRAKRALARKLDLGKN